MGRRDGRAACSLTDATPRGATTRRLRKVRGVGVREFCVDRCCIAMLSRAELATGVLLNLLKSHTLISLLRTLTPLVEVRIVVPQPTANRSANLPRGAPARQNALF